MSYSDKISCSVINYIKKHDQSKTEEELEVIKYGFDALLMNIDKMIVFAVIGYLFHVLTYMAIAIASYGILRLFAFGVHAKSKLGCFIVSFIVFIPSIYISATYRIGFNLRTILFVISFILLFRYAPADTEDRPLPNKKSRDRFKIMSLAYAAVVYIISITIFKESRIGSIIIFSILAESLLITPITYKIFKRRYCNYENYTEG